MKPEISVYEANHGKSFKVPNMFNNGVPIAASARQRLAHLIDSTWFHSNYWPHDDHNAFLDKAQRDLESEIKIAQARIDQLEEAKIILQMIEREESEYDIGES